ncbi:DUF2946 domain-containing protein [Dickeya lacustris]|uniref:DUF2946 domain-containing protein n=1 Tax=Dickeya lacustris TaxID=2259638 RepID=UPI000F6563F0
MSLFELRQSRFAAWIGILALVAIFLAPPISQSLRTTHHVQTPAYSDETRVAAHSHKSSPEHPAHAFAAIEHVPQTVTHDHSSNMAMDHSACGYCLLLSYLPILVIVGALSPVAVSLRQYSCKGCVYRPVYDDIWHIFPEPRAPPLTPVFINTR